MLKVVKYEALYPHSTHRLYLDVTFHVEHVFFFHSHYFIKLKSMPHTQSVRNFTFCFVCFFAQIILRAGWFGSRLGILYLNGC